jgi:hypothetical protein
MDSSQQRRLVKQSYELVERLESARRKIYDRVQAKGESASASMVQALAHAERLRTVGERARDRHSRRMRNARSISASES